MSRSAQPAHSSRKAGRRAIPTAFSMAPIRSWLCVPRAGLNGNTKLGRAFRAREAESLRDLGGGDNASLAERQLVNDNVWCDFIIATMDFQLEGKRQLIRKGKPHPLIDLRMRVAAHRRENYKLHGIKRVVKVKSLAELLDEADEKEQPEKANGQSVNDEDNKPEPQSVKPMEIIESAANVPLKAQWSESTGHSQRCLNPVAGTLLSQNGSTRRSSITVAASVVSKPRSSSERQCCSKVYRMNRRLRLSGPDEAQEVDYHHRSDHATRSCSALCSSRSILGALGWSG